MYTPQTTASTTMVKIKSMQPHKERGKQFVTYDCRIDCKCCACCYNTTCNVTVSALCTMDGSKSCPHSLPWAYRLPWSCRLCTVQAAYLASYVSSCTSPVCPVHTMHMQPQIETVPRNNTWPPNCTARACEGKGIDQQQWATLTLTLTHDPLLIQPCCSTPKQTHTAMLRKTERQQPC